MLFGVTFISSSLAVRREATTGLLPLRAADKHLASYVVLQVVAMLSGAEVAIVAAFLW